LTASTIWRLKLIFCKKVKKNHFDSHRYSGTAIFDVFQAQGDLTIERQIFRVGKGENVALRIGSE